MSQVSKHRLNQKVYEKIFSLFPQFLARLSRKNQQKILVDTFFSSTERIMIAKRVAIAFMLVKGYTYDVITDQLKVSHGTVAKIAENLKTNDVGVRNELLKMASEEAFVSFLDTLEYRIRRILPPKGRNRSTWRGNLEKEKKRRKQPF